MTISSATVSEGSNAVFSVNFDKVNTKAYTVIFSVSNGTAEDSDYSSNIVVRDSKGNEISKNSNGSYTVPAGEISLKVEVQTNNDTNFEDNEKLGKLNLWVQMFLEQGLLLMTEE